MQYLNGKTVYLCGAIHTTAVNDFGVGWRNYITPLLEEKYGIKVLNPCNVGVGDTKQDQEYFKDLIRNREYIKLKKEFYRVIRKDLRAVDKADFLIFHHNPKIPTIGSIHEIVNATNQKKPVLVICDENFEDLNPWLLTLIKSQWLFLTIDEMFCYLDKIHKGEIDTSHWW